MFANIIRVSRLNISLIQSEFVTPGKKCDEV